MRNRWWIGAPLAWMAVVAVVALLAWSVIDSAGEGVLADGSPEPAVPSGSVVTEDVTRTPRPDGPRGSDGPGRTSQAPSGAPTGPTTQPPLTTPAPPPPTTAAPPPPPSSTATQEPPAPVRRTSTWQGEAGFVRVSCVGPAIRLDGASPSNGYEIDKNEKRSGSELEVRFRSADGDRRTEIEARCVGGAPQFAVETDND